jgi:hypothetical protein
MSDNGNGGNLQASIASRAVTLTVSETGIVGTWHAASNIKIYPNPTDGELRIKSDELRVESVEIYDIVGRLLYTSPPPPRHRRGEQATNGVGINLHTVSSPPSEGLGEVVIDISHLSAGMYFIKIDGKTYKIVKN